MFTEDLLISPLEDGRAVGHFQFQTRGGGNPAHYEVFPKSLGQVLHKYGVQELSLSLTQGRWRHQQWGYPVIPSQFQPYANSSLDLRAGPGGAEVIATFLAMEGTTELEQWTGLLHALAGLFCASLNNLKPSGTSYPKWSFPEYQGKVWYGALPREAVCTENLTPWMKLLPCRKDAGIAQMIKPLSVYDADYHSLGIRVQPNPDSTGFTLTQSLTVVLKPRQMFQRAGPWKWSLRELLGIETWSELSQCHVASQSNIHILLGEWMARKYPSMFVNKATLLAKDSEDFSLQTSVPHDINLVEGGGAMVSYTLDKITSKLSFVLVFPRRQTMTEPPATLIFSRYLTGSGDFVGQTHIDIENPTDSAQLVRYADAFPYFMRIFFHTMHMHLNGQQLDPYTDLSKFYYFPSDTYDGSSELELELILPAHSTFSIVMEFQKAFLPIDAFPPDVSRGFDVRSAVLCLCDEECDSETPVRVYSEGLLVLLAFPDQSMPFNVIAFTSTVFAFFFGSLFNMLYHVSSKIAEHEDKKLLARAAKKVKALCAEKPKKGSDQAVADKTKTD